MDREWLSVQLGDPGWLVVAYLAGLGARTVRLPPLVGYLVAGFGLHALGVQAGNLLEQFADLGVTLLLFSIGLKLDLRRLARPQVWAVGGVHLLVAVAGLSGVAWLLVLGGVGPFSGLGLGAAAVIGLSLSFSSTVFVVKALEESGNEGSHHGRTAIAILVLQDLIAVLFLVLSTRSWPSVWAALLLLLVLARRPLGWLLARSGHGELLILFGLATALGGAGLFEVAGLKGDLGALAVGVLLARQPKAEELATSLFSIKDLFLVGFFLSIGLQGFPAPISVLIVGVFVAVLPARTVVYFWLFCAARLRARTAWPAALNLTNYSEFGLIVGVAATEAGLLPASILPVLAMAIAVSFACVAPVSPRTDAIFGRWRAVFKRFERDRRLPGEENLHLPDVSVVVFGLGRMGSRAYAAVEGLLPGRVLGVDVDPGKVASLAASGHRAMEGDATDPEFWSRARGLVERLDWVLLTMTAHRTNLTTVQSLHERGFSGRIAATAHYPDEAAELRARGVDFVLDVYAEAGTGFAEDLHNLFRT